MNDDGLDGSSGSLKSNCNSQHEEGINLQPWIERVDISATVRPQGSMSSMMSAMSYGGRENGEASGEERIVVSGGDIMLVENCKVLRKCELIMNKIG